jgi:decaprenylphospho-beta-D-erythro-pentofuranosid-2-ulose 2-reductase
MIDAVGNPQSVLVLGGTSEIAQAIVREMVAKRVRTVTLAARRPDGCAEFAGEMESLGVTVRTVSFEADDTASHASVLGNAFTVSGGFDVVIVAFAVLGEAASTDADPVAATKVMHTNVTANVSASLTAVQLLKRQGHGTLVVLSSVAGERVRAANYVYGATKAGIDGFAQGLGDSLKGTGVRVLTVRPGFVHTKMTAGMKAAPFATTADVVGKDVARALASGAHTVWSPSILRWVFTAMRHVPRVVWRKLPA